MMSKNLQNVEARIRRFIYITFFLFLFSTSCKASGIIEKDTIGNCEKCVLLTDLSQHRILMMNLNNHVIVWDWNPSQSNIAAENKRWFINYSDVKPVYESKYLLISSSAGGVALIRIADKKAVFYSYAGGNTHSIELLPDGNMVSASSTGNYLTVFHVDTVHFPNVYSQKIYLPAAHNVVWDKKRNVLWSAAKNKLYAFSYNFNCSKPDLKAVDSTNLPDSGAHDLFPVYDKDSLFLTTANGVYEIDPDSKKIVPVAGPLVRNIKSISSGPAGFPILIMKPKVKWWSDEVLDFQGNMVFQLDGLETYKARWFLPNKFSYDNEPLRVVQIKVIKDRKEVFKTSNFLIEFFMQEEKTNSGITRRKFIGQATALSAFFIVPRHVLGGKGYIAPSDKITLGFIGNGKQGLNLQRSFLSTGEVQILATCDVYKAKTKNFIDKLSAFYTENKVANDAYKSCSSYSDFRRILSRKDIDAVVIAAPDFWHAVLAVKAAEAGKDIYCEKPLALTIKEGRAMVNAVHKNQRVFQTGSMQRSWPEFRQTVELIRNGYIGDIQTIKVSVGGPPVPYDLPKEKLPEGLDWDFWLGPNFYKHYNHQIAPAIDADFWAKWRDYKEFGGGGMTDWGAHMFDIVQWALDMDKSGPTDIIPPDGKENLFLTYRYGNGITMTHENFGKNNGIRFIGSKGQIDIQRHKLVTTPESLKDKVIGPNEKHVYFSDNHYKDWLNAIRKRTVPICGVETGHRSATVCNLGNIAYELKRPLKWNPDAEKFVNDDKANSLCGRKMRHKWKIEI